uniref:Beta-ketoacyl synthase n=1 Tax=uncultured bacterium pEAF66 TaxID=480414 RepID=B0LFT9_9BACT|nr:beta-ketoacyl synthase [uncultured bacterium pEAF66]
MKTKVYIDGGSALCAAGAGIAPLWSAMAAGARNLSALPCPAFDSWPWPEVFLVDEPGAAELKVDRKLLRTMEKQAKLTLLGAAAALAACPPAVDADPSRIGLYLGLPTVDEAVPPWPLLEAMHEAGSTHFDSEMLHREVPAFFGLSTLNSNACAHIAGTFGMAGSMGACSPFADAGLAALIEGALSVCNGENSEALVGGCSAKINPLLMLQYEHLGWLAEAGRIPGEGVAFLTVGAASRSETAVRLAGYARGFIASEVQAAAVIAPVVETALAMAGITAHELDWVLPGACSDAEMALLARLAEGTPLVRACSAEVCGALGPAAPVLGVLLAAHAIRSGARLRYTAPGQPQREEAARVRHVLVTARGPEGQYAAVVVSKEKCDE